eukprot:m.330588 g.330588  ORF g.330588 m.330588 type:complete len:59 (-) comp16048_c0_seq1:7060-7236(-)
MNETTFHSVNLRTVFLFHMVMITRSHIDVIMTFLFDTSVIYCGVSHVSRLFYVSTQCA